MALFDTLGVHTLGRLANPKPQGSNGLDFVGPRQHFEKTGPNPDIGPEITWAEDWFDWSIVTLLGIHQSPNNWNYNIQDFVEGY